MFGVVLRRCGGQAHTGAEDAAWAVGLGQGKGENGGLSGVRDGAGLCRRAGQQEAELLATQAGYKGSMGCQGVAQGLGHLLQGFVSGLMTKAIIEGLELIEIQHGHGPGWPALAQPDFGLAIQVAPIGQASERIGHRFAIAQTGEQILPPVSMFAQIATGRSKRHSQQQQQDHLQTLAQWPRVICQQCDEDRVERHDDGRRKGAPEQKPHGQPGSHHDHDDAAIGRKAAIEARKMPGQTGRKPKRHIADPRQPRIAGPVLPRRQKAEKDQRHD
ncbi:MAG TPA: hypothetical protein PLH11_11125 [Gemmobacter sp.]|nr:hypothetical protein [Gemmobacter sp.]